VERGSGKQQGARTFLKNCFSDILWYFSARNGSVHYNNNNDNNTAQHSTARHNMAQRNKACLCSWFARFGTRLVFRWRTATVFQWPQQQAEALL
jgi:hypothetical protein